MSVIDTTTLRSHGFAFAPRLTRAIETIAARIAEAQERRATRRALERLSDHELEDIGLTRGDVYHRF
ncbi:DUF1127 domain-containing protein [Maritimibacter sp. HL-12]|uniref:DUF1127 domain-containing protein n=1 Tax=Maritimibacter sp. HL-12 TaxID=1162418 RepID=UPI000A0F2EF2|nr:DUF1127 domain-containing protein [Maritimibacter sp. HL-12]SMH34733.1 Uncharacterized conserved protein YjiS, DUF1127 family [Maritimibacter sp. HL-12]